jgi:omega-hydroxy-beta-dihydromenaquinone-9 sulfotransferase
VKKVALMSVAKRPLVLHPLVGSKFSSWVSALRLYGGVDRMGLTRAACISAVSFLGSPVRVYENLRFGRAIARERLDPPPVFIIGHWRSGTTNLHNHLLQDDQFGCVSFLQCLMPSGFLSMHGIVRRYLEKRLPETRPMDQVPAGLAEPMSEDFALGSITDLTHYHSYYFPRSADHIFRRTILFDDVTPAEIDQWGKDYLHLLRKVAYAAGGRRLLLKNPAHTGRIPHILKLFPNAKFIHVIRNPLPVYGSTCKLIEKFLDLFSLQKYDLDGVSAHVLERYRLLMERYLRDRDLIPPGQLLEVRHEEMVANPMQVLERIYGDLKLPGFDEARPRMERYVATLSNYQTNTYVTDPDTARRVREACGFAFDTWGYTRP